MTKVIFFVILILCCQSFANQTCESLFGNQKLSADQINKIIYELYKLRRTSLSSNKNEAQIAQRLFNDKLSELKKVMPASEIRETLRSIRHETEEAEKKETEHTQIAPNKDVLQITDLGIFKAFDFIVHLLATDPSFKHVPNTEETVSFIRHATPLQYKELIMQLQLYGDVNAKDVNSRTGLHKFINNVPKDIVKVLIDAGADMYAEDASGRTPILTTVNGTQALVLIESGFRIPNTGDKVKYLIWAALRNSPETIQLYIDSHYDLNLQDSYGSTALHTAAAMGYNHIIRMLATAGANLNLRDTSGETPLGVSLQYSHQQETTKLLRSLGGIE